MIAGLATAWPGMPVGKVEPLHGDVLLDIRQKIISNVLDDPADDPCFPFDHFLFDDDSHSFPEIFKFKDIPSTPPIRNGFLNKFCIHLNQRLHVNRGSR